MPPEKSAYALARYSRSPDSIRDSIEWVRSHDSAKFLESFYFQYGHASIADLGHVVLCFEGVSELAATEIEDEPLWDGQARSSRYQDFSRSGFVTPPELTGDAAATYAAAGQKLLDAYWELCLTRPTTGDDFEVLLKAMGYTMEKLEKSWKEWILALDPSNDPAMKLYEKKTGKKVREN